MIYRWDGLASHTSTSPSPIHHLSTNAHLCSFAGGLALGPPPSLSRVTASDALGIHFTPFRFSPTGGGNWGPPLTPSTSSLIISSMVTGDGRLPGGAVSRRLSLSLLFCLKGRGRGCGQYNNSTHLPVPDHETHNEQCARTQTITR